MKKLSLLFSILFFWGILIAQKHDNIWMSGYDSFSNIDYLGGTVFNFPGDTLVNYKEDKLMSFRYTHGAMCDSAGQLLFYTNGMFIANINHDTIINGSKINPGFWHDEWLFIPDGGYRLRDGMIIVPDLKKKDYYKLFHVCMPDYNNGRPLQLLSTTVDMKGDNGLGEVTEKNKIIFQEQGQSLFQSQFDAVRHANGRDWWLVNILYDNREILLHLYTPDSIYRFYTQTMLSFSKTEVGDCQFSPDGSLFSITDTRTKSPAVYDHTIHLYTFDRCSGQFKLVFHDIVTDTSIFNNGVIFSPSGRYLYQTYESFIFRYDTEAADVLGTKDTIAEWDGYIWYPWEGSPKFPVSFGFGELGPDGNIYVMSASASPFIHKITHPDDPSLCEVIQRIPIPTANAWTVPNYPNYRLGALEGSPCAEMFGPPIALFEFNSEALNVIFGDLSAGVPQTWFWDFGDGTYSQEQHPQHSYANDGTYTTCLTVSNIYGSATYCTDVIVMTSSITGPDALKSGITIIPNPATDLLTIGLPGDQPDGNLFIAHISGTHILALPVTGSSMEILVDQLPAGMYILTWKKESGISHSLPLVIQR
ncbi:MAG: PKD domain-containing protein [Saprospiraceae bacterium]|nr:PKD domain-containing protein [Saprospiraceae bacterium]